MGKVIWVRVDEKTHDAFKALAEKECRTMKGCVLFALDKTFDGWRKDEKNKTQETGDENE